MQDTIKFQLQIKNKILVPCNIWKILTLNNYVVYLQLGHIYTFKNTLFVWNSNLTRRVGFYPPSLTYRMCPHLVALLPLFRGGTCFIGGCRSPIHVWRFWRRTDKTQHIIANMAVMQTHQQGEKMHGAGSRGNQAQLPRSSPSGATQLMLDSSSL